MSINLQRIGLIAVRDYQAAITSRAFLVGLLVMPVLIMLFVVLVPRILNSHSPQVVGEVAVIDPTGMVGAELRRGGARRPRDTPAAPNRVRRSAPRARLRPAGLPSR